MTDAPNPLRRLPSVSRFLASAAGARLVTEYGEGLVKMALRTLLAELREELRAGGAEPPAAMDDAALARALEPRLRRLAEPASRAAVNATGILLHTGLGRAPLCREAVAALAAASGYSVLQTSLETGRRSRREERVEELLRALTGCEAATVVNNNAAATMLVLNTLAAGREVVVSRGQLIEIGGSFRLPDVMAMSGCRLREVGCSNRTHLRDYEAAIGEETGALIHVHTSNYRVRGFAGTPGIAPLAELARRRGLPVVDDLGSGALVPLAEWGLADEPLISASLRAGADAVCCSGDKLIGGPQSGIILGRADVVERLRTNPFARMFRVGKLTLAALEATLVHFVNDTFREGLPFYRLLGRPLAALREQAEDVAAAVREAGGEAAVVDDLARVGSGSLPDEGVASVAVAVRVRDRAGEAEALARRLRLGAPPVFGRIQEEAVRLDMRTLPAERVPDLRRRLREAL
jgi:L-seryl-tRNA(Ser) seleniumtransferase